MFAVDQPSLLVLLGSSDTYLFGLRGRFLAHKCIKLRNLEIKIKSKIKQTLRLTKKQQ